MVKNNQVDQKDLNEGNAEKARLAKEQMAREENREREEQAKREGHAAGSTKDFHEPA